MVMMVWGINGVMILVLEVAFVGLVDESVW